MDGWMDGWRDGYLRMTVCLLRAPYGANNHQSHPRIRNGQTVWDPSPRLWKFFIKSCLFKGTSKGLLMSILCCQKQRFLFSTVDVLVEDCIPSWTCKRGVEEVANVGWFCQASQWRWMTPTWDNQLMVISIENGWAPGGFVPLTHTV